MFEYAATVELLPTHLGTGEKTDKMPDEEWDGTVDPNEPAWMVMMPPPSYVFTQEQRLWALEEFGQAFLDEYDRRFTKWKAAGIA